MKLCLSAAGRLIVVPALVLLTGCTFPLPILPNRITPTLVNEANNTNPYYHRLCVAPGKSFKQIVLGYTANIKPVTIEIALKNTLYNNNFLARNGNCSSYLKATVLHIGYEYVNMPLAPLHMTSLMRYEIQPADPAAKSVSRTLKVHYAHRYDLTFPLLAGSKHTVFATANGAIRKNISVFVKSLR